MKSEGMAAQVQACTNGETRSGNWKPALQKTEDLGQLKITKSYGYYPLEHLAGEELVALFAHNPRFI